MGCRWEAWGSGRTYPGCRCYLGPIHRRGRSHQQPVCRHGEEYEWHAAEVRGHGFPTAHVIGRPGQFSNPTPFANRDDCSRLEMQMVSRLAAARYLAAADVIFARLVLAHHSPCRLAPAPSSTGDVALLRWCMCMPLAATTTSPFHIRPIRHLTSTAWPITHVRHQHRQHRSLGHCVSRRRQSTPTTTVRIQRQEWDCIRCSDTAQSGPMGCG